MIVTLDDKRRVSIPTALAPAAPGDQFDASFDAEEDVVVLRRVKRKSDWLAVWRQCPVPMDDLPPGSRELPMNLLLPVGLGSRRATPTRTRTRLGRSLAPPGSWPLSKSKRNRELPEKLKL